MSKCGVQGFRSVDSNIRQPEYEDDFGDLLMQFEDFCILIR